MLQGKRAQPPLEVRAGGPDVIDQAPHQLIEDKRCRARAQQVATVGAAVIAGRYRLRDALRNERRTNRNAAAKRLPDRHQVGMKPECLRVKRVTGPAESRLYFVGDVERAGPGADVVEGGS